MDAKKFKETMEARVLLENSYKERHQIDTDNLPSPGPAIEKLFYCQYCNDYSSEKASNVKRHEKKHSNLPKNLSFLCGNCDNVYLSRADLHAHEDSVHGIQVNLCQKLLFLHQLTHNMTTDCSLNYKFNT